MAATLRAAVSLLALLCFYAVTFGLIAGTIIGAYLLADHITMMYWVMAAAAVGGILVISTILSAAFARPRIQPGLDVTPEDTPELWALVAEISDAASTPGPTKIRLVSEANAGVSEDSRFGGLIGGSRRMYLGVPLLQGLTVTQLRAVLAHEFGHYSGAHTRLGPIAYRGWNAVIATMRSLRSEDASWLLRVYGWLLRIFAGMYLMLSLAMRRSQEREADRLMVAFAGRANAQAALRELDVMSTYWSYYRTNFLGLGWSVDLAPTAEGFFGGFQHLLAARADELAELREQPPHAESSPLDTHPSTAERIAAIEALPDRTAVVPVDDRPAATLLPAFAATAAAAAEQAYSFGYRERLEWDELVARGCALDDKRVADAVYQAAAQLAGTVTATLATVVALSDAGRAAELVRAVIADTGEQPFDEVKNQVFTDLVRAAMIRSGAARWRLSWSGPFEFVTPDGDAFDADSVGALLAEETTAREAAARLIALGVDVDDATVDPTSADVVGDVVGGISDILVDGAAHDVLVLEHGLVLAENPGADGGWASIDDLIGYGSMAELTARHRFVPYTSMASAKVSGRFTAKAKITLNDGSTLLLKEQLSSHRLRDNSADVFKDYLSRVNH